MEDVEDIGKLIYDNEDNDGSILYWDCNETLVIRKKKLLAPKGDSREDWLRNIFHTTVLFSEKVCKLIIDNDSYENVVSKEAVQKLQLKIDRYLKP